ncbi:MAG: WD40-repeat-containing domain protein [Monoraphidium minutum]|nr:MAG: WD40-repeat-containing domain protein [Monoraphidium minutum]
MEYDAGSYRKLAVKQYPARALRETAEGKYWKRFAAPSVAKQIGGVSSIDFCPQQPYHYAVTASTRVVVYDAQTRQVRRTIARFKDKAYGATWRADGRLLVAGGQDGIVQVFDANSRNVLRQLRGHARAAHAARFAPDRTHVLSCGDDVTVRWWDLTAGKQVCRFDGHQDYVRSCAVSPVSGDTWATGGYDHAAMIWDVRSSGSGGSSGKRGAPVMVLDHGAPIEDVAFFPSGAMAVTAGGNTLCVWDILSGGKLLKRLANFQKTVTCVALSPLAGPDVAAAPRLLAGSLDGHVKVFELDAFKVTHATKYPSPVLSLGISGDAGLLAVGLADGTLTVRKHARPKAPPGAGALAAAGAGAAASGAARRRARLEINAGNFRYFLRGRGTKAAAGDYAVAQRRAARLAPYDRLLKGFQYRDALDAALATKQPGVVDALLEEAAARGGLHAALAGRDAAGLLPLLRHLARYITDPRHAATLSGVAGRLLDLYTPVVATDARVDAALGLLRDALVAEAGLQADLMAIQGAIEPILAAGMAAAPAPAAL